MLRVTCLLLAGGILASAQFPNPGALVVSPALARYLELTPDQADSVKRLNVELASYNLTKHSRISQVQSEIQQELSRESLDAMAIGLRYLELEVIRRELKAEQQKTIAEIQNLLTPAQRTRVNALQEMLRMYPTACDAVIANVMTMPDAPQPGFAFFLLGDRAYYSVCTAPGTPLLTYTPVLSSTQSQ